MTLGNRKSRHEKLANRLGKSEGLFNAIFEFASVGIAQIDLDGRWVLLNQKICEIVGYGRDELSRLTVAQISHPEDVTVNIGHLRRLVSGETSSCSAEKRFIHKDGSVVWVDLTVTLVRDASGAPEFFIAVVEDISERRRVEDELRQSEEKFHSIFALAPIGISISTLADARFVEFNDAAERLSGYRRDEVIGHTAYEFSIWREPQERDEVIREVMRKGEVRDREMVMKEKNGRTFWALYSGVVIEIHGEKHLLSLVSDIGERKKAQEALEESEARFRLLADNAPVLIWEAGPDSRCTFTNKAWLQFTGRKMEQELGDGWAESVHPEDLELCLSTYRSAFAARQPFTMEYRLRRSDGVYSWVVDSGVPRLAANGELLGFLGTTFDLSSQKQAKEELQQANRLLSQRVDERTAELSETIQRLQGEITERIRMGQALQEEITERHNVQAELREKELMLLHQGRLAAMGEMIGNIAHQWRQPLNLLGLVAQELAMSWKKGVFSAEYLEKSVAKMLETIRHMSQTIDDFRDFFKPDKEKVEFRVLQTVEKTISLLDGSLKSLEIRTVVLPEADPQVKGYPNEFAQVLLNIMANSRDAFAANPVAEPTITVLIRTEGGRCVVTITDNAGGIPEEIMDRIFEPYFTTKPPDKGTGVGLFMSRTIIEKNMGGTLTACNVDGGARFRIVV